MVHTRSSTGNLPPPKFKSLLEDDYDWEIEDCISESISNSENESDSNVDMDHKDGLLTLDDLVDIYDDSDSESESESESDGSSDVVEVVTDSLENVKKLQGLVEDGSQQLTRFQRAVIGEKSSGPTKSRPLYRKARVSKRSAGKLAGLIDAPLDVFVEVASYLSPLDLLHLARTSLQLRALLMSRQSRTVWKASRNAIGMPNCPEDLDEPVYASLVFEKHCNVCGASQVHKPPNFVLRLRLCAGCSTAKTIVKEIDRKLVKHKIIYDLIPNQRDGDRSSYRTQSYYFKPDFVDIIAKYISFADDTMKRDEFVTSQQKRRERMVQEGHAIGKWVDDHLAKKHIAKDKVAIKRRADIIAKLKENGWSDEDIILVRCSAEFFKYTDQPRELTQRIWNTIFPKLQILLPRLKAEMEEVKRRKEEREKIKLAKKQKARLECERNVARKKEKKAQHELEKKKRLEKPEKAKAQEARPKLGYSKLSALAEVEAAFSEIYQRYVSARPNSDGLALIPNISDMVLLLPGAIRSSVYDRSLSGTRLWDAIVPLLPSTFAAYTKKLQDRCWGLLLGTRGSLQISQKEELMSIKKNPSEILFLGWAFFKCNSGDCASFPAASYPAVFGQEHKVEECPRSGPRSTPICSHMLKHIRCPAAAMQSACMLLASLNLPLNTRMSHLYDMGDVFICLRCSVSSDIKMSWRDLVVHFSEKAEQVLKTKQSFYCTTNDHFSNPSTPLAART